MQVGLTTFLLLLLPSLGMIWNMHQRSTDILNGSIKDDLIAAAKVMATLVDPEKHATFQTPAQEASDDYLHQIEKLGTMRPAIDPKSCIKFVYTCVQKADGIHFVLDDTPPGDADHDGVDDKAHIMEPYPEANEALKRVFVSRTAEVNDKPYSDKWGTFLSGYAPVFDAKHQVVAVTGVDLALTDYQHQIAGLRLVALLSVCGAIALAYVAGLAMARYHRKLCQAFSEEEGLREAALAASRAKSDFLATMSHELRTPLNAIIGNTQLLGDAVVDEDKKRSVAEVHRAADSLLGMITDLLDYSAMDSGKVPIQRKPSTICKLVSEACDRFRAESLTKDLSIQVKCDDARVMIDPVHVKQLLRHLISNAIKFTQQGSVSVTATFSGGMLRLSVKDTGIGISDEKKRHLFDLFDQEDMSSTRVHGGMGIGLAICKRICDSMGGRIIVTSAAGQGSEFQIEIPAEQAAEPGTVWLVTKDSLATILVRTVADKAARKLAVVDDVSRVVAADGDLVLLDLGSVPERAVKGRHVIAMNADPGVPLKGNYAETLFAPLKPADVRRVLA